MRRGQSLARILLLGFALSCDDGPTGGEVVMEVSSPLTDIAAIEFRVIAAESKSIEGMSAACMGCQLFSARTGDQVMRGVIIGQITPGPLVRVTVSDAGTPSAYTGLVMELAASDYSLLPASETVLEVSSR